MILSGEKSKNYRIKGKVAPYLYQETPNVLNIQISRKVKVLKSSEKIETVGSEGFGHGSEVGGKD